MDNIWLRGVFKQLEKKSSAPRYIRVDSVATFRSDVPTLSTMQKWATDFRLGRANLEDDAKSARPAIATTDENINRTQISREKVKNILDNYME